MTTSRPALPLPPAAVLVESLQGRTCPACGGTKVARHSLCRGCYMALPTARRDALYRLVGRGYEEAMAAALRALHVTAPHWPPPPRSPETHRYRPRLAPKGIARRLSEPFQPDGPPPPIDGSRS